MHVVVCSCVIEGQQMDITLCGLAVLKVLVSGR